MSKSKKEQHLHCYLNRTNLLAGECVTKDASRYALSNIGITPKYTFATDGHKMILIETPRDLSEEEQQMQSWYPNDDWTDVEPCKMHTESVADILKMIGKEKKAGIFFRSNGAKEGAVEIDRNGSRFTIPTKSENGFLPDPNRVRVPDDQADMTVRVNLDLLIPLLQTIQKAVGDSRHHSAKFLFYRNQAANLFADKIKITAENESTSQKIEAYIMPYTLTKEEPIRRWPYVEPVGKGECLLRLAPSQAEAPLPCGCRLIRDEHDSVTFETCVIHQKGYRQRKKRNPGKRTL